MSLVAKSQSTIIHYPTLFAAARHRPHPSGNPDCIDKPSNAITHYFTRKPLPDHQSHVSPTRPPDKSPLFLLSPDAKRP